MYLILYRTGDEAQRLEPRATEFIVYIISALLMNPLHICIHI